jgi:hypothetical protein
MTKYNLKHDKISERRSAWKTQVNNVMEQLPGQKYNNPLFAIPSPSACFGQSIFGCSFLDYVAKGFQHHITDFKSFKLLNLSTRLSVK